MPNINNRATQLETPAKKPALAPLAVLLASVVMTVTLYWVPYGDAIGYPLILFSTLIHELGHGTAALLVGGSFESLTIGTDGSGLARWSAHASRLDIAVIAAGGLLGPAVFACTMFFFGRHASGARRLLIGFGVILIVAEVFVVRGLFAFSFVAVVAGILLLLGLKASSRACHFAAVFLATQLSLSVFSRGDYLFTDVAQTSAGRFPSDTAQIAQALWLPYWFWGTLIGALSVMVLLFGLWSFFAQMSD